MRVALNSSVCQAHGRCYDLAADLFDCDDLGYALVIGTGEVPGGREDAARLAVASCPERAISIEEHA